MLAVAVVQVVKQIQVETVVMVVEVLVEQINIKELMVYQILVAVAVEVGQQLSLVEMADLE
jgi:hypothetical protein